MNNKKLGTDFETEFCELLASRGYWVHFISPAPNGGQPFDVVAAKGGEAFAFDCKTCAANRFTYSRLEDNQIMAFELWMKCGNNEPRVAVKHKGAIYLIPYKVLKEKQSVALDNSYWYAWSEKEDI